MPARRCRRRSTRPHRTRRTLATYLRNGDGRRAARPELAAQGPEHGGETRGRYLVWTRRRRRRSKAVLRSASSLRGHRQCFVQGGGKFLRRADRHHRHRCRLGRDEATETSETAAPNRSRRISIPRCSNCRRCQRPRSGCSDDSAFDIEGWLAGRIARQSFAAPRRTAFVNGDGGWQAPGGSLSQPDRAQRVHGLGVAGLCRDRQLRGGFQPPPTRPTRSSIWVYALRGGSTRGRRHLRDEFQDRGRGAQDEDGRRAVLVSDGLAAAEPARLMGYRLLIARTCPTSRWIAMAIAFGDFRAGYTIAERARSARAARPVQRQAACAVLRHQARGRGGFGFRGDQADEVRRRLSARAAELSNPASRR